MASASEFGFASQIEAPDARRLFDRSILEADGRERAQIHDGDRRRQVRSDGALSRRAWES